jgi:hypothetical protein
VALELREKERSLREAEAKTDTFIASERLLQARIQEEDQLRRLKIAEEDLMLARRARQRQQTNEEAELDQERKWRLKVREEEYERGKRDRELDQRRLDEDRAFEFYAKRARLEQEASDSISNRTKSLLMVQTQHAQGMSVLNYASAERPAPLAEEDI